MAYGTKSPEYGYEPDWSVEEFVNINPMEASVDGQGGTIKGKPVFTVDEAAAYLNRGDPDGQGGYVPNTGPQWAGAQGGVNGIFDAFSKAHVDGQPLTELAFGFYESQASLPEPYLYTEFENTFILYPQASGFSPFSEAQRAAARDAIQAWDDLIAIDFVEKSAAEADINFMNTTTGPIQASAYLPYNYGPAGTAADGNVVEQTELAGDIFINPLQPSNFQFDEGQYGLSTLVHELGHSLGLKHPGDYNFSADFDGTYETGAFYYQDSEQYTIMSYWGAEKTGAAHIDWSTLQFVNAATPLVHDIAAIQRIYGADMTTRTGDTVYGFNSTADRDAFDFDLTPLPVVAIWDAGGEDTLDFSGWDTDSTINLNPGSFSSGGGSGYIPLEVQKANGILPASYTQAQYDNLLARYNSPDGMLHDNIAIAYGVTIENAVGGGGDDLIIANDVANVIDGGDGSDTVSYEASDEGVVVQLGGNLFGIGDRFDFGGQLSKVDDFLDHMFRPTRGGFAEGDQLISIENVTGSDFRDSLLGDGGDNVIDGGAGNDILTGGNGDDALLGGDGNDHLVGGRGNDVINGGAGDDTLVGDGNGRDIDTFVVSDLGGTDTILDFRKGKDELDLSGIDAIADNEGHDAFSWIGKDAFSGEAGELRSFKSHGRTFIEGDVNGDGAADFSIVFRGQAPLESDIIFG